MDPDPHPHHSAELYPSGFASIKVISIFLEARIRIRIKVTSKKRNIGIKKGPGGVIRYLRDCVLIYDNFLL